MVVAVTAPVYVLSVVQPEVPPVPLVPGTETPVEPSGLQRRVRVRMWLGVGMREESTR